MMKFKKFLAAAMTGAMMFGMVATAAPAVSTYAEEGTDSSTPEVPDVPTDSETVSNSAIKIDYDKMTATVKSSDPYVIFEIYKDPTKADKVSNSYIYPTNGGKAVVDLGFYKATKAFGIRVYGNSDMTETGKSSMVTVNPQPGKLSFKVNTSKTTFLESIEKAKEGKDSVTFTKESLGNYSYRSLYASKWENLDKFDYDTAKVAGTTIVVRKNATDAAPAGPEAKIKIAASAKAPKVTIDYVKGTVKVSEKMEIAQLQNTALADTDYKGASKNMTIADIAKLVSGDTAQGFTIAVRTTKTDKKAASMPCLLYIKPAPVIVANGAIASTTTSGSSITVEAVEGGLKLTPKGGTFQYEKSAGKWVSISAETTIKTTEKSVKVRTAPVKENVKNKIEGEFASNEETITAPAVPSTEDETEGGTTTK